ncbi:hypothetical protein Forpi1262_v013790 [Fusarium oxysporum f. sp. raphani]|uniref:Uncharacterized protein n=1 Tax=Fusarium oxysporum f. sp. raphani TaxID=96318 RepID=A0A8J5PSL6_FUSOX|nr:hypothetical protein Forpi1262_v013790 [Fusarium oxysporum f. sp. raphani]
MTSDAPAADMCQCARAKGEYGTEGELAATVICPDCHLEQSTFPEPDNAEQPDLISERDVYIAFTGSSSLLKIAEKHPNDQSIQKAVKKREKSHQGVKDLINNYGMSNVVTTIRVLLDDHVFTCTDAARHRFPNLFPEEQESQALGSEYSPSKEIADGFEGSGLQTSQHGQTLQDCRLLASLPIRPRQRLMSQLQIILEHACFAFGQRTMQKDLDDWGWTCAEAVPS